MKRRISHNGHEWLAEIIKSANLSTGYRVYLMKRDVPNSICYSYVVAVKSPLDRTCEWHAFEKLRFAVQYYVDMLCCYA